MWSFIKKLFGVADEKPQGPPQSPAPQRQDPQQKADPSPVDMVKEAAEELRQSETGQKVESAVDQIADKIDDVVEAASDVVEDVVEKTTKAVDEALESAPEPVRYAVKNATDAVESAVKAGTEAVNEAVDTVTEAAASLTGAAAGETESAAGGEHTTDFVIIGAGPAAVAAAETLRKAAPGKSVLMIDGEPGAPYSRMAIPYVLTGLIEESGTNLRKEDGHYANAGITMIHDEVTSVDANASTLSLKSGGTCTYGKLLVATGASPIDPPVKGLDLPGVHHCWTLEDARGIAERAAKGSDVLLMGAGFIGCIILESLVARGTNLTVVEAEDRMVPRMMNETAGGMIKRWCEEKGITVHTSTRVTELTAAGDRISVSMDNGQTVEVDLVVVATGVKSNTGFLEGTGIEIGDGIKVNEQLQSSIETIYAAGDCAEGPDFSTGGWSVHAIQPTATEHGRIAALNMAGGNARYKGSLNMNVLDTAGLISASFGAWDGVAGGDHAESNDEDRFRYTRLEFDGDKLVGALTLGRTDAIGVLRGLIQSRAPLGVWKDRLIQDPNRLQEAYIACVQQKDAV